MFDVLETERPAVADYFASGGFLLGEGSLYERLRRDPAVDFDPQLAHGGLIYDDAAAQVLEGVHRAYLDIGQTYGLAMIATAATWRASAARIAASAFAGKDVNGDNVAFLKNLVGGYAQAGGAPILVGGQLGPRGDAYRPEEALVTDAAEGFHAPQIESLTAAGAEVLLAQTLPAFSEALGLARALAKGAVPYILSFVVRRNGCLLDGTPLAAAIRRIDDAVARPPLAYALNCVHPTVAAATLAGEAMADPALRRRVVGLLANTSAREPAELDGLDALETEAPAQFAEAMWALRESHALPLLGGCCGTGTEHIEEIARRAHVERQAQAHPGAG